MYKTFLKLIILTLIISSCKKEVTFPDDRFVLEGIIENPGFTKLQVSELSKLKINTDHIFSPTLSGYFGDSIFTKKAGFYNTKFGTNGFSFYAEPGKRVRFKTNYLKFEESVIFEGDFAEQNNFIYQTNLTLRDTLQTLLKDLFLLEEKPFLQKIDSANHLIESIIKTNKTNNILPVVEEYISTKFKLELQTNYDRYPMLHKVQTQNTDFEVSESYKKNTTFKTKISDSLISYLPQYRQYLLQKYTPDLQQEMRNSEKQIKSNSLTPVYVLQTILDKDSTLKSLDKEYLLATFAANFDYKKQNPLFNQMHDSLLQIVKNPIIKSELQNLYENEKGLNDSIKALPIKGLDKNKKAFEYTFNKPTLLYFYSTYSQSFSIDVKNIIDLQKKYSGKLDIVSINANKEVEWDFFMKNTKWTNTQVYLPKRYRSEVAKFYRVNATNLPKTVLINADGTIFNGNAAEINNPVLIEQINQLTNPTLEKK